MLLALAAWIGLPREALAGVTPLVAPDHWAVEAARRMEALGLVDRWLPAQNAVPVAEVERALREAAANAPARAPGTEGLASALHRRFGEEFRARSLALRPRPPPAGEAGGQRSGDAGEAGAALLWAAGTFGGSGSDASTRVPAPARLQPAFVAPATRGAQPALGATAALALGPHLAASARAALGGDADLEALEVAAGAGPVTLAVVRGPVAWGVQGAGVLFSGSTHVDRVELRSERPVVLPGWLRLLGPVSGHAFLSRIREARHDDDPFLAGIAYHVQPHPRFTFGMHYGLMFIPRDEDGRPFSPWDIAVTLASQRNVRDNKIFGTSYRLRLPTERVVPLTVEAEWAGDDYYGAHIKAPGLALSLAAPALPGLPSASLAVEYAFFGIIIPKNMRWYTSGSVRGGWVLHDAPLGHPLGGNGWEWRLRGAVGLADERVRLSASPFLRWRDPVSLYAPLWSDRSGGLAAKATWRVDARTELAVAADGEWGQGWRTGTVAASGAVFF